MILKSFQGLFCNFEIELYIRSPTLIILVSDFVYFLSSTLALHTMKLFYNYKQWYLFIWIIKSATFYISALHNI